MLASKKCVTELRRIALLQYHISITVYVHKRFFLFFLNQVGYFVNLTEHKSLESHITTTTTRKLGLMLTQLTLKQAMLSTTYLTFPWVIPVDRNDVDFPPPKKKIQLIEKIRGVEHHKLYKRCLCNRPICVYSPT